MQLLDIWRRQQAAAGSRQLLYTWRSRPSEPAAREHHVARGKKRKHNEVENMFCTNCGQWGHRTTVCPNPKFCYECWGLGHMFAECDERPVAPRTTHGGQWPNIHVLRLAFRALVHAECDHERSEKQDWEEEEVEVTWLQDLSFAVLTLQFPFPLKVGDKVFVDEENGYGWRHHGKIVEVRLTLKVTLVKVQLQRPHWHDMDPYPSLCKVISDWHGTNFEIQRKALLKADVQTRCMSAVVLTAVLEIKYRRHVVRRREYRDMSVEEVMAMLEDYNLPARVPWEDLNFSQMKAVAAALDGQHSGAGAVTLIKGPPGTGKTHTGVCAVLAMASKAVRGEKILVTAPSNKCVDHFAKKLVGKVRIVRIFSKSQVEEGEIDVALLPYALHKMSDTEGKAALRGAQVVCCTLITAGCKALERVKFKNVVVDEAAQATVPEVLVALVNECKNLLMIGDDDQMKPQVHSKQALHGGLDVSLFQRLNRGGFPTLLLNVQYRMHPALSRWPMQRFYRGMVRDGVRTNQRTLDLHKPFPFPTEGLPKVMVDVRGEEAEVWPSFKNEAEAEMVLRVVHKFLDCGLQPERLCVLTPYDGQEAHLKMKMEEHNVDVEVTTADGFQGQERDVVILSTVRTRQVGFLNDRRRLNVAVTRAKFALVVVGNTWLLRRDVYWRSMVDHYQAQGCFVQVILSNYIRGE